MTLDTLRQLSAKWRTENGDYPESKQDCADELDALLSSLGTRTEAKQPTVDALHDVFTRHGIASRTDLPVALISDLIHWAAEECRGTRTEAPQTGEGLLGGALERPGACICALGWPRPNPRHATSCPLYSDLTAAVEGYASAPPTGQTQEREP